MLEECACKIPVFPGLTSFKRRPAESYGEPVPVVEGYVELLLAGTHQHRKFIFLVLGRSEKVVGAHTRLGLFTLALEDLAHFESGRVANPGTVTII